MTFNMKNKKAYLVGFVIILASVFVVSEFLGYDYFLTVKVNYFHSRIYKVISNDTKPDVNLIISSFSIHSVLSMLALGARGETEYELFQALGYPRQDFLIESYKLALKKLKSFKTINISMANRIYLQNGMTLNKNFSALSTQAFAAGARNIDFANNVRSANTINSWVEGKTNRKIKNLIDPSLLSANTALVLVNAIYFKGLWDKPFDPKKTESQKFQTISGNEINVEMMNQKNQFNYEYFEDFKDSKFKALEMDYKGKNVSMVVILPDDTASFNKLEKEDLSNGFKNVILEKLRIQKVTVGFPKFKIETSLKLNKYLPNVGIKSIFGGGDLSGLITNESALQVSHVIHKAFVEVNELGTEAAAATAVIMTRMISLETEFICNKPFLFYIIEKPEGKILFAGKKVA